MAKDKLSRRYIGLFFFYLETLGNTFLSADFSRTMESEKVCDVLVVFVRVNAILGDNGHREVVTKRCRNSICNEIALRRLRIFGE